MAEIIIAAVVALLVIITVLRSVRIIPQARARNIERFGRYRKTLEPGMNFIIPGIDRVKKEIDLREQVVSFTGAPVITEDNLSVLIDTVLFFQVTDPRAADYEIVNYIQAIEQITATMLRSVIGSMDLEKTLTSRDHINNMLRGVLDDASGKWGIRVTRVEIKAIDPPKSVKDAMEKQMRAEREKRAVILTSEGAQLPDAEREVLALRSPATEAGEPLTLRPLLVRLRAEHGVERVICEGGSTLNTALLAEGVVAELFVAISPLIAHEPGSPPIVAGVMAPLELELVAHATAENFAFLRYALL
jgi:regulator of protease activity HflC (stomatin/prohibitin superfamily)